jgi:hypothetical protein
MPRAFLSRWRWAALPFGALYLVLLAAQFRGIVTATYLDADAVSAPVIGQLFGDAPAHANVVLGEFGWYSTLLFDLATKWLPFHRQIWEGAPYLMALAGAGLAAWSVWQVAGRWAAGLTAALLICAAPDTLHLLLSTTQHGPDWFCCALLAAFLVAIETRASTIRAPVVISLSLLVGAIVGVNAASDLLLAIAGLVPFVLALLVACALDRGPHRVRKLQIAGGMLVVTGVFWVLTLALMSGLNVAPQPGLDTTKLAAGSQVASNFRLWWQSIAVLGNGDFFGQDLSVASGLAVVCAALSLTAVGFMARAGWRALSASRVTAGPPAPMQAARLPFLVFWCSSAALLTGAFLISAQPIDIHADRYLVGVIYAAAAVIPAIAVGRSLSEAAALAGTCVVALGGVVSLARGIETRNPGHFPSVTTANRIAQIAAGQHIEFGYAGYWDAAPITWASHLRVQVYPVSVCDSGAHLCHFDLHYISSWYTPRPGIRSFLLVDPELPLISAPTPDLGPPVAVYHVGRISMYVYPYDLAGRLATP